MLFTHRNVYRYNLNTLYYFFNVSNHIMKRHCGKVLLRVLVRVRPVHVIVILLCCDTLLR